MRESTRTPPAATMRSGWLVYPPSAPLAPASRNWSTSASGPGSYGCDKREQKLRERSAEVLLVVITSAECADGLRSYVVQAAEELEQLQVHRDVDLAEKVVAAGACAIAGGSRSR